MCVPALTVRPEFRVTSIQVDRRPRSPWAEESWRKKKGAGRGSGNDFSIKKAPVKRNGSIRFAPPPSRIKHALCLFLAVSPARERLFNEATSSQERHGEGGGGELRLLQHGDTRFNRNLDLRIQALEKETHCRERVRAREKGTTVPGPENNPTDRHDRVFPLCFASVRFTPCIGLFFSRAEQIYTLSFEYRGRESVRQAVSRAEKNERKRGKEEDRWRGETNAKRKREDREERGRDRESRS